MRPSRSLPKRKSVTLELWAMRWKSKNKLDGASEHFCLFDLRETHFPTLFRTRREALEWRDEKYGYIRQREDLRSEPHGWRLPSVMRVRVTIEESA